MEKHLNKESSFLIPMNQTQYKLIRGMFDRQLKFKDSIFYDISSWTLPLAYGLDYEEIKATPSLGEKITEAKLPTGKIIGTGDYAYAIEPYGYYTSRAMYKLLDKKVRVKVATEVFHANGKTFDRGSLMIPIDNQLLTPDQIQVLIKEITEKDGLDVYAVGTGLDYTGVSLGSSSFEVARKPVIAILVDDGISPTDAGELWHLLDTRFQIPVTLIPINIFNRTSLEKYNTIIFPEGSHSDISDKAKEKLKGWVQEGGVLIGFERALNWFTANNFGKFDVKKDEEQRIKVLPKQNRMPIWVMHTERNKPVAPSLKPKLILRILCFMDILHRRSLCLKETISLFKKPMERIQIRWCMEILRY